MELERPRFQFEARGAASSNSRIRGRAVPYGIPDRRPGYALRSENGMMRAVSHEGTVFEPGAFREWLTSNADRVVFLFQHGDSPVTDGTPFGVNALPIGVIREFNDRLDGLYFEAEFASHDLAQAVKGLTSQGGLSELSFACTVDKAEVRESSAGTFQHVLAGKIWDVSVVVWGQFGPAAKIIN